jgi:hypothetical protein
VSPLFGKSEEKAAQEAAAEAEVERLNALPVATLAAEIMPAFGPDGPRSAGGRGINILQVANWLIASYPRGTKYLQQLQTPVREGVQALEHAGLVQRWGPASAGSRLSATRLGETALAEGDVLRHLGT